MYISNASLPLSAQKAKINYCGVGAILFPLKRGVLFRRCLLAAVEQYF